MLFCLVVHSGFLKIWKAGAPVNLEDYVAQALVTSRQGVRIFEFFGGLFIHELGGFQLLDLIIPELKSHVIPYKIKCSHWWKIHM